MKHRSNLGFALFGVAALLAACSGHETAAGSSTTGATGSGGASSSSASGVGSGVTSVVASTSVASTGTGAGGGDADWRPVPWAPEGCPMEYAAAPANAFPALEWGPCDGGEAGCSRLVKNWNPFTEAGLGILGGRRSAGMLELSMAFVVGARADRVSVVVGADGATTAAFRSPGDSVCFPTPIYLVPAGAWFGAIRAGNDPVVGAYAFSPGGLFIDDAMIAPLGELSQGRAAGDTLFAIEHYGGGRIDVYDRARDDELTTGLVPGSSFTRPVVIGDAVFLWRFDAIDDPTVWVFDGASGSFHELIGGGPNVVGEVRGDASTLIWTEVPPFVDGGWPPGTLFTAPFTTDPKQLSPTTRWSGFRVPPGAPSISGGGRYATVSEVDRKIYMMRLEDGRRWEVPIPVDPISQVVANLGHLDEEFLFLSTDAQIYRIELAALGDGLPGK